jgi:hypothetical protein
LEYSPKSRGDLCRLASSHPPARTAVTAIPAELFLVVPFFGLRRFRGLRKSQRQCVAVVGRCLPALLHVGFRFQYQQVAPVDMIAGAGEIHRDLFIGLDRAVQQPVLQARRGSRPESSAGLRQPLLLAMCLGFRLDCLQAPLVRSALRATISPRPDAAPRALTAGLFFSRSFFNRLDWHSHSQPPRFASPIVALISSRINPVLLRIRRSNVLPLDLETDLDGYLEFVHSAGDDATPFLNDLKPIHVTDGF